MIRIQTLGGLTVRLEDGRLPSSAALQPRRLALLALLARAGEQGITRDKVVALLWPDADDEAGRRGLTQALYGLRTGLDAERLILGVQDLRLNRELASSDLTELDEAMAGGEYERAASLYKGPFLDGFRVPNVPDFERWVDEVRDSLTHRYAELVERLARSATERGDATAGVGWWRRRAAMDALNARVTIELMRALTAVGEQHAALQQARIYEALIHQELALAPDREVVRYAEELRRTVHNTLPTASVPATETSSQPETTAPSPAPVIRSDQAVAPNASPSAPSTIEHEGAALSPEQVGTRPARRVRARYALGALLLAAAITLLIALQSRRAPNAVPLLAVGAIADYRGTEGTGPLTDMLATNLARIPGLQVTSTGRLLELIDRAGKSPDAAAFAAAAQRAGASDLLEGGLHPAADGLVLELRRVDLATGRVLTAWRLEGKDFFTLVDRATTEFATSLGRDRTQLGPGEPNTRSLVAWRLYEEGLRQTARGDYRGAQHLFESALREDSLFAMAALHWLRARSSLDVQPDSTQLAWLTRLARRANDRDRLQILGWVAFAGQSPALDALADTLIIRYPTDIESQYLAGFARMARADFLQALPFLQRVIAADSASVGKTSGRCLACDALALQVYAYQALDSIPTAHAVALAWTRRDPQSGRAWASLGSILDVIGRYDEAVAVRRRASPHDAYDNVFPVIVKLRSGDFAAADQMADALTATGSDDESTWQGFWMRAISLRYQARWRELAELSRRRFAAATEADRSGGRGRRLRNTEAIALLEAGRPTDAIRILDSLTRSVERSLPLGGRSRVLTMQYALLAEAALASGNVALLSRAADSAAAWAQRDGKTREVGIALHARALRELASHDTVAAMRTFEQAMFSPTMGFTRSNYDLARLLLGRGDARKASSLLRAALQGSLETTNYYITHTELHELLAEAYARLGQADSARVHWSWVTRALAHADSAARPRYVDAVARLGGRSP